MQKKRKKYKINLQFKNKNKKWSPDGVFHVWYEADLICQSKQSKNVRPGRGGCVYVLKYEGNENDNQG